MPCLTLYMPDTTSKPLIVVAEGGPLIDPVKSARAQSPDI